MKKNDTKTAAPNSNPATESAPSTELAPIEEAGQLQELEAYQQFAGAGFENQTSDDYSIPFLSILQPLSKQLQENSALKAGMIVNTVTGEAYDGKVGVVFVPATTEHLFVEWKPRSQGGGFVAIHKVNSPVVDAAKAASKEFGKYSTPAKEGMNDLVETFYAYGIAEDPDGNPFPASLAFKSTQIKKYTGWQTRAKSIQIRIDPTRRIPAPLFSHRYRLTTYLDTKNPKGAYHAWKIDFDGPDAASARLLPSAELFQAAVGIKAAIESGAARAAIETEGGAGEDAGTSAAVGSTKPAF